MKIYNVILFLSISLIINYHSNAQTFEAKIIGGLNASQLEGDNLSGFNKPGLHSGVGISYRLVKNSLSAELLFNQKGSSSSFSINSGKERQSTNLNYLQIPILYSIDQWYFKEDDYYRIAIEGGPYFSRLFRVRSTNSAFDNLTDRFKKNDFGIVIGAKYRFVKRWSATFRYDQSFFKIYQEPASQLTGLLSYLVTLRLEYHL